MSPAADGDRVPSVEIFVHPDHALPDGFDLAAVETVAGRAVEEVLACARNDSPIYDLDDIEVTLVSDAIIADVHVRFMSIEGATDVITFDHGEIVISTETAAEQGRENGNSIEKETALYLVHGLLHLAGYADRAPQEFAEMARLQVGILERIWV